jgi:hypothetical protein
MVAPPLRRPVIPDEALEHGDSNLISRKLRPSSSTFLLIATLGLASNAAAETSHEVRWRTIGASHHSAIDLNGKGSPASFTIGEGDGTFGVASVYGMFEPQEVPIDQCPAGTIMEFHAVAGTMVRTFRPSLDQVFIKTVSGLACIFEDGSVTSENQAIVTGGTGRFEGATGTLVTKTLPKTVSFPEWKGEFNNIINVTEGSITLRD